MRHRLSCLRAFCCRWRAVPTFCGCCFMERGTDDRTERCECRLWKRGCDQKHHDRFSERSDGGHWSEWFGQEHVGQDAMGLTEWSGLITYDGKNIADLGLKERATEAGILLQDHVSPDLSVQRLVRHGRYSRTEWPRKYNKVDEEVTNSALKMAGISDLTSRKVCELSGGQRQPFFPLDLLWHLQKKGSTA